MNTESVSVAFNSNELFTAKELGKYFTPKLVNHCKNDFINNGMFTYLPLIFEAKLNPAKSLNYLNSLSPEERSKVRALMHEYTGIYSNCPESGFLLQWFIINEHATKTNKINYQYLIDNLNNIDLGISND